MKITRKWKQNCKTKQFGNNCKNKVNIALSKILRPLDCALVLIYIAGKISSFNFEFLMKSSWRNSRSSNSCGNKIGDSVETGRIILPFTPTSSIMRNVLLHARDGRHRWVTVVTRWSGVLHSSGACDERLVMLWGVTSVTGVLRPSQGCDDRQASRSTHLVFFYSFSLCFSSIFLHAVLLHWFESISVIPVKRQIISK